MRMIFVLVLCFLLHSCFVFTRRRRDSSTETVTTWGTRPGRLLFPGVHDSLGLGQSLGAPFEGNPSVLSHPSQSIQVCPHSHARIVVEYCRDALWKDGSHLPAAHPGSVLGRTPEAHSPRHRRNQRRTGSSPLEEV